jgi:hypothetical protein
MVGVNMGLARDNAPISPMDVSRLDSLNALAAALRAKGTKLSMNAAELQQAAKDTEYLCQRRIEFQDGSRTGKWFRFVVKRGDDYVRVNTPNQVTLLCAKIDGVVIQMNLKKPGGYDHGNETLADALRKLASILEQLDFRAADREGELLRD